MFIGVDAANPNRSESWFGFPVGEWLMVAVSPYRPTWGVGGATWNVCWKVSGLTPPTIGMVSGPAMSPVIPPTPSMSSLYSETIQKPPTTGVATPVRSQVSWTSNSSSTSSSEVFSFSDASSTSMTVTSPSKMGLGEPRASVAGVWSEPDRSDMIFLLLVLLRGRLPEQAIGAGAGYSEWLPLWTSDRDGAYISGIAFLVAL